MHTMTASPSSSPTSSRSYSPDSRATTPATLSYSFENSYLPSSYVYLRSPSLSASALENIFKKHAVQSRLGLIIGQDVWSLTATWDEHSVLQTQYWVSSSSPTNVTEGRTCLDVQLLQTLALAGLRIIVSAPIAENSTLHILERPPISFPPLSLLSANSLAPSNDGKFGNIPTIDEWKVLWAMWDLITLQMIPKEMLHQKPIHLRHKCLFYIGHIPTFLDMLISKCIGGQASEPQYFWNIFERGIDPHVDDPDHCHRHSEVPEKDEDWPTLEAIMGFRDRVRARLTKLYEDLASGNRLLSRSIARMLVMTHEHEGFHIETLLYMLIQRASTGTLPPPGFSTPLWPLLEAQWADAPIPVSKTVVVRASSVVLGQNDSEAEDVDKDGQPILDVKGHTFGWDNESPIRKVEVGTFRAEWRCVTNGEFMRFWRDSDGKISLPTSWIEEEGEVKVRTMYGSVPFSVAEHWPVTTTYDDLLAYAKSKGGRLPTEPELRLFLDLYDVGYEGGSNVAFRNWHPVAGTMGLEADGGRGHNGGVWEWTNTVFDKHEGLVPTNFFTGYSEDFFDGKHQVALGASYATIPRLAGRRTVRNFYQHNYGYGWIAGRVVYDV